MFDAPPLPVDEATARAVAVGRGPDAWVEILADAVEDRRVSSNDLLQQDYELFTDVPGRKLVEAATRPTDLARVLTQLEEGRDEVGRAAFRILRRAAEGSLEDADAAFVASAALNVHAHTEAPRAILAAGQQGRWLRWAELVPDPARRRLLRFAELTADAA
jgi:hypothetical protein